MLGNERPRRKLLDCWVLGLPEVGPWTAIAPETAGSRALIGPLQPITRALLCRYEPRTSSAADHAARRGVSCSASQVVVVLLQHYEFERNVGRKASAPAAPIARETVNILAKPCFARPRLRKIVRNVGKANGDLGRTNMRRQLGHPLDRPLAQGHRWPPSPRRRRGDPT